MAPGSSINSSVPGTGFASFNGTSMAVPHVAGALAVLRSAAPSATPDQLETALESTGPSISRAGISKPRIQVDAAADALLGTGGRPLNDNFADAIPLAGSDGSATGSNVDATQENGEPVHAGVGGGSSVWWRWQAPETGAATISTFGSDYDTVLAVYTGPAVGQLTPVASNDDSLGLLQSQVEFTSVAGTTYQIAVDGFAEAQGNIVLNHSIEPAVVNDHLANAIPLRRAVGSTTGTNRGATAQNGEPRHAGAGGGKSVWWRWRAPSDGDTIITTVGSNFDTVLAIYTGPGVRRLTEVASNDDGPGTGNQSLVRFNARAGVLYRIAVDGVAGTEGDITLLHANLRGLRPSLVASSQVAPARRPEHLWATIARYADLD
jgi:Subtilase family